MMKTKSRKLGYYFEKFRAFLLVLLMALCVIQIGILWSSQSGSVPFYFLSNLFTSKLNSETTVEEVKEKYILPYRIVLSAGFDDDHYIIPNGSSDYTKLWDGARVYLTEALNSNYKNTTPFSEDVWGGLVAKKPYTFEFSTLIPIDIFKWALDMNDTTGKGLNGIYKFVICPDDPDNNYADTVYIRDNNNIYTYEVADFKGEALDQKEFDEIEQRQRNSENSKNYKMAIEAYKNAPIKISLDLLGPLTQKSRESYPAVNLTSFIGVAELDYSPEDFYQIGKELFGQNSNAYDYDVDTSGSAVFKNGNGVYRLYKNSVLEYKDIGSKGTSEKGIVEAYKKAISFIMDRSSRNDLMSNLSVYLKSIDETGDSFVFNFDYSVALGGEKGEVPVLLKDYKINESGKTLNNCLSIEATSRKVINCEWLVLNFKPDEEMMSYQWSFPDMHAKVFNTYEELGKQELSAKDFGIYYVLNNNKLQAQKITPSFVLFTMNGSYDIPIAGVKKN